MRSYRPGLGATASRESGSGRSRASGCCTQLGGPSVSARDTEWAMSQENVQLVKAALDAWARDGVDAALSYWTDDLDHRAGEGAIDDRGPIHGKDAMRGYAEDWLETFDDIKTEAVEL